MIVGKEAQSAKPKERLRMGLENIRRQVFCPQFLQSWIYARQGGKEGKNTKYQGRIFPFCGRRHFK